MISNDFLKLFLIRFIRRNYLNILSFRKDRVEMIFNILKNIKKRAVYIALGVIFILSLIFDKKIITLIAGMHNPVLGAFMLSVAYASESIIMLALVSAVFYFKKRNKLLNCWFILAVIAFATLIIKLLIHRTRPFTELDLTVPIEIIKARYSTWDTSFISWHTALAFSVLAFFRWLNLKKVFIGLWIAVAVLTAFSRIYFGLHYLTDVIAGACLGFFLTSFLLSKIKNKK